MSAAAPAVIRCPSLDDPRLADYRDLRTRPLGRQGEQGHFVVEGRKLGERLLQSGHRMRSILIERGLDISRLPLAGRSLPIYELTGDEISRIAGFHFHRGLLASADRPAIRPLEDMATDSLSLGLVGISDMENVGGMLRSAAAFGIRQVIFDSRSVDPLSRRSIRVSMGAALTMKYFRFEQVPADLQALHQRGIESLAATLADDSVSVDDLEYRDRGRILLMGNENDGLPLKVQRAASRRVRISMTPTEKGAPLLDSLNVCVAASILMYDLSRRMTFCGKSTVEPS